MAPPRKLPQTVIDDLREIKDRTGAAEDPATKLRANVRAVLGTLTEIGEDLTPKAPLDRALTEVLRANAPAVQRQIGQLRAYGEPGPLDYYDILYKLIADSGLVTQGFPPPDKMRRMINGTIGIGGLGTLAGGGTLASDCDCGACGVCGACGACAACEVTAAVSTAGTVGTLGGAAAIGYLL